MRLSDRHLPALEELLLLDPVINLFMLGFLEAVPISRSHWYGVQDDDRITGVVVIVPGRLTVPYCPDLADAELLASIIARRHKPTMMVGPRAASDILWEAWARPDLIDRFYDQRLYVCEANLPGEPLPGFRRARLSEWGEVAEHAAAMELEDLGRTPKNADPEAFEATIKRRIENGTTWVVEREGRLQFQINVGTRTPFGVQVGGTYVPAEMRGQGMGKAGMRELGRRLLPKWRRITLHVNEANTAAVRVYEASGYRPYHPFRLLTLTEQP